jgi:hypothetical protein
MSEIPLTSIFAIVGVVVGFALSQLTDLIKSRNRKRQAKEAVSNELSVIKDSLSSAKKDGDVYTVSTNNFPFVCDAYDCLKVELASSLKPKNLASLNKAYVHIKELNINNKEERRGYIMLDTLEAVVFVHNVDKDIAIINEAIKALS